MITHTGGCHCGRVRFEVLAPAKLQVSECNCSVCSKSGYLHLVVPADRFKLLSGSNVLTTYSLTLTLQSTCSVQFAALNPSTCRALILMVSASMLGVLIPARRRK